MDGVYALIWMGGIAGALSLVGYIWHGVSVRWQHAQAYRERRDIADRKEREDSKKRRERLCERHLDALRHVAPARADLGKPGGKELEALKEKAKQILEETEQGP